MNFPCEFLCLCSIPISEYDQTEVPPFPMFATLWRLCYQLLRCNIFFLGILMFFQRKWLNYYRKERKLKYPLVWWLVLMSDIKQVCSIVVTSHLGFSPSNIDLKTLWAKTNTKMLIMNNFSFCQNIQLLQI